VVDQVSENLDVPRGPDTPDPMQMLMFDRDLNKQLVDYMTALSRKANASDLTDGGAIVGNLTITGDLTITGALALVGSMTITGSLTVADEAYDDTGWNGDLSVPTKNSIRDIWETLGSAAFKDTGTSGNVVPLLDQNAAFTGAVTFDSTSAYGGIQITTTAATDGGPTITFKHLSPSPAANDNVSVISFQGLNSVGSLEAWGQLVMSIIDPNDGSEDAVFTIAAITAGTYTNAMSFGGGGAVVNGATGFLLGSGSLNAVTLYRNANLVPGPASQAQGDLLYRGASDWERLAKGTAGQILAQNSGLTAPEWVSPDLEYVGTVTASSSSELLIDSSTTGALAAGYDYLLVMDRLQPSADGYITLRYGTGGTPTYQTTGYTTAGVQEVTFTRDSITSAIYLVGTASAGGAASNEEISGEVWVYNVGANARHTTNAANVKNTNTSGQIRNNSYVGERTTAEVLTGLRLAMNTGNINSGTVRVYRRRTT